MVGSGGSSRSADVRPPTGANNKPATTKDSSGRVNEILQPRAAIYTTLSANAFREKEGEKNDPGKGTGKTESKKE